MYGIIGGINLYWPLSRLNLTIGLEYCIELGWEADAIWELLSENICDVMFGSVRGEAAGVGGVIEHCVTTSIACTTFPLQPLSTNSSTTGESRGKARDMISRDDGAPLTPLRELSRRDNGELIGKCLSSLPPLLSPSLPSDDASDDAGYFLFPYPKMITSKAQSFVFIKQSQRDDDKWIDG